jgi:hypothetical protein
VERFVTVAEAAALIRAAASFIYNCRSDRRLTPHKSASRALVDRAELEGLIRSWQDSTSDTVSDTLARRGVMDAPNGPGNNR